MTATSTSIWADSWRAISRLLEEADWPAAPIGTKPVKVFTSGFGKEELPDESILLITETIDDEQSWASLGEQRRNETFVVQIDVATLLAHRTWSAATDRLEQLVAVIERLFHQTARPQNHPAELAGRMVKWQVTRVAPQIGVQANGSFFGGAVLLVSIEARIKPTAPNT